jgi:hypothetical protein
MPWEKDLPPTTRPKPEENHEIGASIDCREYKTKRVAATPPAGDIQKNLATASIKFCADMYGCPRKRAIIFYCKKYLVNFRGLNSISFGHIRMPSFSAPFR